MIKDKIRMVHDPELKADSLKKFPLLRLIPHALRLGPYALNPLSVPICVLPQVFNPVEIVVGIYLPATHRLFDT
jgi:hypothetical protein